MSTGSWLVKVWSVLLAGALLAVASNPAHARFAWLAVFLTLTFWLLDSYLERQRALYRGEAERVRRLPDGAVDFSLDTAAVDGDDHSWSSVLLSRREAPFYAVVLAAILVVRHLA